MKRAQCLMLACFFGALLCWQRHPIKAEVFGHVGI